MTGFVLEPQGLKYMSACHDSDMVRSQWSIFSLDCVHSGGYFPTLTPSIPSHHCMTVLSCRIALEHGDFLAFACIAHTTATSCSSPSCSASLSLSLQSACCTDLSGARNISLARQGTCRTCGGICTVVLDQRPPLLPSPMVWQPV